MIGARDRGAHSESSSARALGAIPLLLAILTVSVTGMGWSNEVAPDTTSGVGSGGGIPLPPIEISGSATMNSDFYANSGNEARRPGAAWQMSVSPRITTIGGIGMSVHALLSSEGVDLRQNINQIGLSPSWRWITLHLGDFSRGYSPYTLEGTRLRGAGIDLTPGIFTFSVQGGRAQRTVAPGAGATVYKRNMFAARLGVGGESGSHFNLTLLSAKDDIGSVESSLIVNDTILVDTIPHDLRPEIDTRPQQNLVVGLDGQIALFGQRFVLNGEVAAALITHDLLADSVDVEPDDFGEFRGIAKMLTRHHPVRISSAADYAYKVGSSLNLGPVRLRGGYEEVGPGYTSLGLSSMLNDRRGYDMSGSSRFFGGRLGLNGQYRHQTNNLLGQRKNTVDRNTSALSASLRASDRVTTTLSGVVTSMVNDAPTDSAKLDTRSLALTSNLAIQQDLFGLAAMLSFGYSFQRTSDGNPLAQVSEVDTHSLNSSVQLPVSQSISLAPNLSGVITKGEGMEEQKNLFVGFSGNGRFLDGDLRTSANLSQSVSQGQQIFAANAMVSYPIGWGTDLTARARFNRYSSFNQRPGFQEALATLSVSRSF